MTSLSLILPVHNRRGLMGYVFNSLASAEEPPEEIIVVEDGSTDGGVQDIANEWKQLPIRYINTGREGAYLNSSYPYNVGIRAATQEAVVYCAAELIHLPQNFVHLRAALVHDVFVVGGSVFFESELEQLPEAVKNTPELIWKTSFDTYHADYIAPNNRCYFMRDSNSGVHAVWRQHLLDIAGFDESLTSWGHNDANMRRRLTAVKGLPEVRIPQVTTIHQWHPRPPDDNMRESTSQRLVAESSPLRANSDNWGESHATIPISPPDLDTEIATLRFLAQDDKTAARLLYRYEQLGEISSGLEFIQRVKNT